MSESQPTEPNSPGKEIDEKTANIPNDSKSEPHVVDGHQNDDAGEGDNKSITSSAVSDLSTSALFPLGSRSATPTFVNEARELGLSAPGWFSDFTDYDVITVHGLRDNHSTVWKSKSGVSWLQTRLLASLSVRQLDYIYATDDTARVFRSDGIESEARRMLRLYANDRNALEPTEANRPIIWVCHDIGGTIVKQALIEASQAPSPEDFDDIEKWEQVKQAYGQIARLSTMIIFLGCPHKIESIDVLEDELHNLMILPGPDIRYGLIRKLRSIARQVDDTNTRFLEAKFFSRVSHINVFNLQSLGELRPVEGLTGGTAPTVDALDTKENGIQNVNDSVASEQKSTPNKGIPEPPKESDDFSDSDVDRIRRDDNEDGHCTQTAPLEELAEAVSDLETFDPVELNETEEKRNANIDSVIGSVELKGDTMSHDDSRQTSLTELTVARPSPFSRYTICLYSMFEISSRFRQSEVDHAALVKGDEDIDGDRTWVAHFKQRFDSTYYSLSAQHELIESRYALLSLLPPTRLPKVHTDPEVLEELPYMKWIINHQKFRNFDESVGPYTLCIQGYKEDASRMAMVSEQLYTWYGNTKVSNSASRDMREGSVFYFQFDKFDSRYNSIKSMLATFLSEVTSHVWSRSGDAPTAHRVFESLEYCRSWSLSVLYNLFTELRRCDSVEKTTIILGCFDSCVEGERNWFLAKELEHQSHTDLSYRLVITTTDQDQFLKECLPDMRVVSLDECRAPLSGYSIDEKGFDASEIGPHLEDLLRQRPILGRLKQILEEVTCRLQTAPYLGYRILDWLSHFGRGFPIADIAATINKLRPVTPENVLSVFIHTLPVEKRNVALAIYRWVKYALEPLTIEALCHALAVSTGSNMSLEDIDYDCLLQDIRTLFSGVIVVEGRIVKFSHDSFYHATIADDEGYEDPPLIHCLLAKACLNYLMHHEVQQRFAKLSVDKYSGGVLMKPLIPPRDDLLEYAVLFWAEHYRLSESYRPIELALDFFRDNETRKRWAEAHYLLSNPFTRIHRSYASPLPLAAALGLQDVVTRQVEEEKHSRWFQQDTWLAITEATRNGHQDIVHKLLGYAQLDESGLRDAIIWAGCSAEEGTLTKLLESISVLDEFSWPKNILSHAAIFGLDPLVTALIEAGYNLDEKNDETGETAIHTAIIWGQQTVVKLLLDHGLDLSVRDTLGRTALLLSVEKGRPEIVQMLLNAGASVNEKDASGVSVVNKAISYGEHGALTRLLSTEANHGTGELGQDSSEFQSPLVCAAVHGRLQCVRILLENGADLCTDSDQGTPGPLYILCIIPHIVDSCRLLLENGAKPNQTYKDKEMLLHRAMRTGDKELVGLLVERGATLDSLDTYEDAKLKTPLAFAIAMCSLQMVQFLLQKGASVNYAPEGAESPLFTTAWWSTDIKKAEFLLDQKADIHWERSDGWTALHAAYDLPEFLSLFLRHGADVNKMSDSGTLLMMAARWNLIETLKILLAHSPLPNLNLKFEYDPGSDEYGNTALMLAVRNGNHQCASLLLEAGAELDDKLKDVKYILQYINPKDPDTACKMMRDFLCRGTTVDYIDDDGNTALHGLVPTTPVEVLQTLVNRGAPLDSSNQNKLTPLGVAVEKGNIGAARYFISKGVRVDILDPKFGSFLHLACYRKYAKNETAVELLELLIDAQANTNVAGPEPSRESLLHAIICKPFDASSRAKLVRYLVENSSPAVNVNAPGGLRAFPIIAAAYNDYPEILEYLVRHHADVDVADNLGRRTIHYMAAFGWNRRNMRPIQVLAKWGADMQATDRFGRTVLHLAAGTNNLELVNSILRKLPKGYDINVQDSDGWTPLMWACRNLAGTVIQKLIKICRADIWPRSTDGEWSAMRLACLSNQDNDVKDLLQPPEHERERENKDGPKEVWDCTFHIIPPGNLYHGGAYCDSCFAIMIGPRYKCTVCEDFDLCFKCFTRRTEMHHIDHELKEYYRGEFVDQEESERQTEDESNSEIDDDDV